ncbi:hypothetical protein C9374_011274 [Naegleria lovaniensis]|uniref:Uncharacterized protein n=1 Tax=Naegleria lovaniensis TaxID=51637 RepID=A0AA88GXU7_NAELO|nr:uncharacterized protein C9374_011274 [Naegleria lovaniensis]KAG2392549.1 hypothetical protein C9374_011274 [Naegleria lovaniensis]
MSQHEVLLRPRRSSSSSSPSGKYEALHRRVGSSFTLFFVILMMGMVLLSIHVVAAQSSSSGGPHLYPIDNISPQDEKSTEAYVVILTDDSLLSAARVVAKSVRETKSTHPFVAIVTDRVSERSKKILKEDKFILIHDVPSSKGPIYPYMLLWYLGNYGFSNVIFLSTDVLVKRNIDSLFKCKGRLCATNSMTIPDDLDIVYMGLKTDINTFNDMVNREQEIVKKAYDNTPQAFMTTYFDWRTSEYIDDKMLESGNTKENALLRMPVHWNGFEPLYYTYKPSWDYMEMKGMRIINYCLIPKPWDWFVHPILDLGQEWLAVFHRLPVQSITPDLTPFLLLLLPIILAAICFSVIGRQSFHNKNVVYDFMCGFCNNLLLRRIFVNMNTPWKLRIVGYISCFLMAVTFVLTTLFFHAIQSNEWDVYLRWAIYYSWVLSAVSIVLLFYYKLLIVETTIDIANKPLTSNTTTTDIPMNTVGEEESDEDQVVVDINDGEEEKKDKKPFISKLSEEQNPLGQVIAFKPTLFWFRTLLLMVGAPIMFVLLIWVLSFVGADLGGRAVVGVTFILIYSFFLVRLVFDVPIVAIFKTYERKYGPSLFIQNEEEFKGTKYN